MASVNQTRPHCVNQMGKTHSKRLVARHGRGTAWARHGCVMASVNQTRPHCVNQMGKTHSKRLAARHGRGTAWARHAMCESAFRSLFEAHRLCELGEKKSSCPGLDPNPGLSLDNTRTTFITNTKLSTLISY